MGFISAEIRTPCVKAVLGYELNSYANFFALPIAQAVLPNIANSMCVLCYTSLKNFCFKTDEKTVSVNDICNSAVSNYKLMIGIKGLGLAVSTFVNAAANMLTYNTSQQTL